MVMELLTRTLVTEPYAGVNTDVWREDKKTKKTKPNNINTAAAERTKSTGHTDTCDSHFRTL